SLQISEHDDARANPDALVKINHVLVAHPDAAGGDVGADGPGFVGAVDTIERGPQIHRARSERIFRSALHVARQIGPPREHLRRRRPIGPLALCGDRLDAGPGEAGTTYADAVTQRPAVAFHQEQELVGRVDHNGAAALLAVIFDLLLRKSRVERTLRLIDGFVLPHELRLSFIARLLLVERLRGI